MNLSDEQLKDVPKREKGTKKPIIADRILRILFEKNQDINLPIIKTCKTYKF